LRKLRYLQFFGWLVVALSLAYFVGTAYAAYSFVKTPSHQYLRTATPCPQWRATGYFTAACWFNASNTTESHVLLRLEHESGEPAKNNRYLLIADGTDAVDRVKVVCQGNDTITTDWANTTWGFSADTWHLAAVTCDGAQISAHMDPPNVLAKGTYCPSQPETEEKYLQVSGDNAFIPAITGRVCEVAVWNIVLASKDLEMLGKGISPLHVRPDALIFYAPVVRDGQDIIGGFSLTATGATPAPHARILH